MHTVSKDWANYLRTFKWTHTATIRLHYKVSQFSVDIITTALVKNKLMNYLFYCVEDDRYDINHIHLLMNASSLLDRPLLAKGLGKDTKAVSYIDEVKNNDAISWYCSKNISRKIPYDLKFKEL